MCPPFFVSPVFVCPPFLHSKIYHNRGLRASIDHLLQEQLTIDEIRRRIVASFGEDLTPSRSAIGRYVRRVRLGKGYPRPNMSQ